MKITKQDNVSECGICVINSFVNYYFNKDIKNELLNDACVTNNGLSILEFERLCNRYGLICDSYEITINELFNLDKLDKYFCLLIDSDGGNHYVIGSIINKDKIRIYDSDSGEYTLTYEQLSKIFMNVVITIRKIKNKKINNVVKTYWFDQISYSYLLINILVQLFIVSLNVLFGLFFNLIIDLCINNQDIKILILITFSFLIISTINNLSKYLLGLYINKYLFDCYKQCKTLILSNLFYKKTSFFYKINPNYVYYLNTAIVNVCTFNIQTITETLASLLVNVVCVIIIFITNYRFGIIMLLIITFEIIYTIINTIYQKKIIDINFENNLKITKSLNDYINNNFSPNSLIIDNLFKQIDFNYQNNIKNIYKQANYEYKLSIIKGLFQDFIYLIIIFTGTIIIWNNNNFNIGKLLFVINTMNIFYSQTNNICLFFNKKTNYLKMRKIFLMFYEIDNINNNNSLLINKVENISIKINDKVINLINGKSISLSNMPKIISHMMNGYHYQNCEIKINGFLTNNFNQMYLNNTICYFSLTNYININDIDIGKILVNDELTKIIREFDIPLVRTNFIEQSKVYLLNLLYLCLQTNRIIILDNFLNGLTVKMKSIVNKKIIPYIIRNNFLIINEE